MDNYKNKTKLELIAEIESLKELNNSRKVKNSEGPLENIAENNSHWTKTELQLNDSQNYLSVVFNNAQDLLVLVKYESHKKFQVVSVNQAYIKVCKRYGLDVEKVDFIGNSLGDIILNLLGQDANVMQNTLKNYQQAIDSKKQINYEESIDVAGKPYHSKITLSPILDSADGQQYVLYNSHDVTAEKEALRAVQLSEEKFRSIFENSPIGKSITGIDGSLEVNESFCDIVGYSVQELKTKKWQEITHPDDISQSTNVTQELLDGIKDKIQFEKRYIHKNGSIVWTDVITVLERDNDNKPEYFITSIQNITEKKISEQAIRENEVRYRELVDAINSGVAVYKVINDGKTGKDYIIKDFNKTALKLEGLEKKQVLGKSLLDIRPNIDDYGLIPIFEKVWRTKKPDYFPSKEYTDNKYSNYYENRVFCLPNGDIVAVYDDVTERENAVLLVKRNQERLDLALNATKDGIYDWNLVSNDIYYSPPWKSMLGYKDDELPNDFSIWENLTKPEDVERSWKMQQELISKQRDRFEMEFKMKHKNGHWVDIFSRAEAVFDESGKAIRVVGTHVDITERKKAEEELSDSLKRERNLADTVRNAPVAIANGYPDGRLDNCNKAFVELTGYTEAELKNLNWNEELTPSHWNNIEANALQKLNSENNTIQYEKEYKHKNGSIIPVELFVYGKFDEQNNLLHYIGFIIDITERKQFSQKLQERNDYIESLMENMPIGFAMNTIDDGEVKYMNNRFEDIYGWSRDILTNTSVFFEKVFPEPKYREKMTTQIITDLQSGDPKRMIWKDLKIVTSTGEVRYVSAYNIPLLDQNLMISTVQDTTQVKLAEDEITKHREHLEVMVKERTKDLEDKNKELERFNELFVDREFRIKELRDEIEKLSK